MATIDIPPANLVEELDQKIVVWLRDGTTIIGKLRSIDQFANLVLQDAIERVYVGHNYGDIPRGIYVIRGENVALLGTVDPTKVLPFALNKMEVTDIWKEQKEEQIIKEKKEGLLCEAYKKRGLSYNPRENSLELQ